MLIDENKKSEMEFEKETSIFLKFVSSPYSILYIYMYYIYVSTYTVKQSTMVL